MSDFVLERPVHNRPPPGSVRYALMRQAQVLHALLLQDIKSRSFGNGFGWMFTIAWPMVHMIGLVVLYYFTKRPVAFGSSAVLYASTGAAPYVCWVYMFRFCLLGQTTNRPFLNYPVLSVLDMLIARIIIEFISLVICVIALLIFLYLWGVDAWPVDVAQAFFALGSAFLLGIGCGIIFGLLAMVSALVGMFALGLMIVQHIACGVTFEPEQLPHQYADLMWWNPLLHSVEWMRSAYYSDYPAHLLSKTYVLSSGLGLIMIGLAAERLARKTLRRAKR